MEKTQTIFDLTKQIYTEFFAITYLQDFLASALENHILLFKRKKCLKHTEPVSNSLQDGDTVKV